MTGLAAGLHCRAFAPDLEVKATGDGRTIYGIAVPYNAPTRIDASLVEQFSPGAFNHQLRSPQRVKYAREHMRLGGELIGALSFMRDDPAGLYVEMRVSRTARGDETLELVRDGALRDLSIMFYERQNRNLPGGVTDRVKADLVEVASVLEGAYGELAAAAGVRSATGGEQGPTSDLELLRAAEKYLVPSALPDPPDHDLAIRSIRLGLPF